MTMEERLMSSIPQLHFALGPRGRVEGLSLLLLP